MEEGGRLVDVGDTSLYVVEKGAGRPLLVFHGGPGLDHREFGDYLDALADEFRLVLVDERSQGRSARAPEQTWTLSQMAADVSALANAMGFDEYATLGHSYGAFIVLQHAVDFPGDAWKTIVSSGVPSSRYLEVVPANLAAFEPESMREQVSASWEREQSVRSADEVAQLMDDQLPFHFRDPLDARIADYARRTAGAVYSPEVLRKFSADGEYGGIDVEPRLGEIPQPVLVLAGRYDRACSVAAAEAMARGIPDGRLVVFEHSGHMSFVEENDAFLAAVREFLRA